MKIEDARNALIETTPTFGFETTREIAIEGGNLTLENIRVRGANGDSIRKQWYYKEEKITRSELDRMIKEDK